MALRDSSRGARTCPKLGLDRKSPAEDQTDALDPKRASGAARGRRNRRVCVAGRHHAGGGSIYYHVGSYTCSGGKWKGELTTREHEPGLITTLFARKVVTMGFTGTYTDDGAEFEATALVGKRSVRLKVIFRLLIAD
jgi:hypothetical protein